MDKATLLFVSDDKEAIISTKSSFVEFFGMRMIEDTCSDFPILRMNTVVDSYDMNNASKFIPDNVMVLILTAGESFDIASMKYSYIQIG